MSCSTCSISVINYLNIKAKIYIYCSIFINFVWVHFSAHGTSFILVLSYRLLNFLPSFKSSTDLMAISQVINKCINRKHQIQSFWTLTQITFSEVTSCQSPLFGDSIQPPQLLYSSLHFFSQISCLTEIKV